MYHEIIPLIEHAAPVLAAALTTVSPIAGTIVTALAHTFNAENGNVGDLVNKISSDASSDSKLQMLDKLLGTSPADIIGQRQPSKVEVHLVITYDSNDK